MVIILVVTMSFSLQLPEILDAIASFVSLPSDLLALALVNKTLCGVIIPQDIEFRGLCCDASRDLLWELLADNPGFSRRIISLELRCEPLTSRQLLIPQSFHASSSDLLNARAGDDSNSSHGLPNAIAVLSSLQRFFRGPAIGEATETVFEVLPQICVNSRSSTLMETLVLTPSASL
jgi:hypothetical protein